MRHLDPDDDKGHRRCDISYVMACRQKEVRQRNIEENEENACDESHERRCAQLQEHFLHSEFMINCVSLMLGIFFIPFYMYLLS